MGPRDTRQDILTRFVNDTWSRHGKQDMKGVEGTRPNNVPKYAKSFQFPGFRSEQSRFQALDTTNRGESDQLWFQIQSRASGIPDFRARISTSNKTAFSSMCGSLIPQT